MGVCRQVDRVDEMIADNTRGIPADVKAFWEENFQTQAIVADSEKLDLSRRTHRNTTCACDSLSDVSVSSSNITMDNLNTDDGSTEIDETNDSDTDSLSSTGDPDIDHQCSCKDAATFSPAQVRPPSENVSTYI